MTKVAALSAQSTLTTPEAPNLPLDPAHPSGRQSTQPSEYRGVIREEVSEMAERDERRHSIIIKGLKAQSPAEVSDKFVRITQEYMGFSAVLPDIRKIPGHADIFRANIVDDEHGKTVLETAKLLRDSRHSTIYFSRDLTYAQRYELYARWQAMNNQAPTGEAQGGRQSASSDARPTPPQQNASLPSQGN